MSRSRYLAADAGWVYGQLIRAEVEAAGVHTDGEFCLENYHRLVNDEQHAAIIKQTRVGFERNQFPIALELVCAADLANLSAHR